MNLTLGEMSPLGKVSLQRPRRTPVPAISGRQAGVRTVVIHSATSAQGLA